MIDMLDLKIPFKYDYLLCAGLDPDNLIYKVDILKLSKDYPQFKIEYSGRLIDGVDNFDLRIPYDSLPSSMSGMAMKVYPRCDFWRPYISIKCSPAKILQAHNLFGFTDFKKASDAMFDLLEFHYPNIFNVLDLSETTISNIDCTFTAMLDQKHHLDFISFLKNIANGQTSKSNSNHSTTAYWGSRNSDHKFLKCYLKEPEMQHLLKKSRRGKKFVESAILESLIETEYCKKAVRFEASIRRKTIDKLGYSKKLNEFLGQYNDDTCKQFWAYAFRDVFKTFEGELMKTDYIKLEDKLHSYFDTIDSYGRIRGTKANNLLKFYKLLKMDGYDNVKKDMSKSSFYRNISDLLLAGCQKGELQNLNAESNVVRVNFGQVVNIDFGHQYPEGYKPPVNDEPYPWRRFQNS